MDLKNIKLVTKLMVGFAIVLVLAAGQSLFAVYGTTQLSQNSSEIANEWLPGTYYNGTLGTHISRMRTLQFQFVGSFSQTDRLTLENALTDEIAIAAEALKSYAKLSHGGPEAAHFEAVQKHCARDSKSFHRRHSQGGKRTGKTRHSRRGNHQQHYE